MSPRLITMSPRRRRERGLSRSRLFFHARTCGACALFDQAFVPATDLSTLSAAVAALEP